MTWLTENPFPVLLIGSLTTAILAGGWLRTGSKWLLFAVIAAIAVTVGLVLAERWIVTDREQVTQTLHDLAAVVERNEVAAALELRLLQSTGRSQPSGQRTAAVPLQRGEYQEQPAGRSLPEPRPAHGHRRIQRGRGPDAHATA